MIIAVLGQKGGAGKSTIATQLAASVSQDSKRVLLIDGDEQGTASKWISRRPANAKGEKIALEQLGSNEFYDRLGQVVDQYDDIIIDVAGRDSEEMRTALSFVDVALFPLRPTINDLETAGAMDSLVSQYWDENKHLKKAMFVLSQSPANPMRGQTGADARDYLSDYGNIETAKNAICSRVAYENAAINGVGVAELNPKDRKAVEEIEALKEEIYNV